MKFEKKRKNGWKCQKKKRAMKGEKRGKTWNVFMKFANWKTTYNPRLDKAILSEKLSWRTNTTSLGDGGPISPKLGAVCCQDTEEEGCSPFWWPLPLRSILGRSPLRPHPTWILGLTCRVRVFSTLERHFRSRTQGVFCHERRIIIRTILKGG